MKIPDSFKRKQQEVFQDKTVEHLLPVSSTGALGTITLAPATTVRGEHLVNFQIVTDELKAKEWGLTVNKDATIKVSAPIDVAEGDYIKHNAITYRVCGILSHDAYTLYQLKAVKA